jgi:hypothetical protein
MIGTGVPVKSISSRAKNGTMGMSVTLQAAGEALGLFPCA